MHTESIFFGRTLTKPTYKLNKLEQLPGGRDKRKCKIIHDIDPTSNNFSSKLKVVGY